MALSDLNFEIKKGDIVGIIGKNGAGKSTLLKILSQITKPTSGRIEINGRVASLLEVGTGFHPELTGRENIFLNGTILGMTRKEVSSKFDEIVEFSGVEKFIDTPVKHYSSGMYVRLAFAVAAHLEPEILIIDEVLAVGDAEFQKKCLGKMKDVAGEGRTVIFVSHDMNAISSLCRSCMVLKNGKIDFSGKTIEVINYYLYNQKTIGESWVSHDNIKEVSIKSAKVKITGSQPNLKANIKVKVESKICMLQSFIAFNILNGSGQMIGQSIPELEPFIQISNSSKEFNFIISIDGFVPDSYFISIWIGPHFSHTYDWKQEILQFQVIDSPQNSRTFPHSKEHGAIVPNSKLVTL